MKKKFIVIIMCMLIFYLTGCEYTISSNLSDTSATQINEEPIYEETTISDIEIRRKWDYGISTTTECILLGFDENSSEYDSIHLIHQNQDEWIDDTHNIYIRVKEIFPNEDEQKCYAIFKNNDDLYFALSIKDNDIPTGDINTQYVVVNQSTYLTLLNKDELSTFLIQEELLNY